MKKLLKSILLAAAMTTAFGFFSCGGSDDGDEVKDSGPATPTPPAGQLPANSEVITVTGGQITYTAFDISEYTKYAKAGAKLHLEVENGTGDGAYCKVLLLTKDWGASEVSAAYYEGDTENQAKLENDDDGNKVRTYVEGEGEYYFVLNEAALSKSSLALMGNATVKKLYIEYVGGKKTEEEANPPKVDPFDPEKIAEGAGFSVNEAKDTFTYTLAWAPATKANVQLVFQNKELPVVEGKAEAGHNFDIKGTFSLKLNDEVIWEEVEKTFTVKNNAYGEDYILKTNILSDKDLVAGDVITLTAKEVKVLAKDETDAALIKTITTTIIDDSEDAGYWKDLLNTKIANNTLWEGTAEVKAAADDTGDGDDTGDTGSGEVTLLENLALGWSGTDTVCADKDIAVGGTIYFTITTTGKQELQFIKKSWAGGLGKDVITILNSDGSDVTYYSGAANCTEEEKDRPSVSLDASTATYHFVVTEAFVALKDVATVVGSATLDKMWYVAPAAN